jgi:hypothetical protein
MAAAPSPRPSVCRLSETPNRSEPLHEVDQLPGTAPSSQGLGPASTAAANAARCSAQERRLAWRALRVDELGLTFRVERQYRTMAYASEPRRLSPRFAVVRDARRESAS